MGELGQSRAALKDDWVGTWAMAPRGDGTAFNDQTLRQVVHTSIGGTSVRVRLSNAFGNQPLSIDNVHVAERASGASIVPQTDQTLKFAGQGTATISAGQSLTSDAVTFAVKPLADLVVSFHIQNNPGGTTAHGTGLQDNYIASGNVAGNETLNGAQTKGNYFFLTNVDVQNAAAWGAVVTLGASITDGVASGGNDNRRWPNDLAKRLSDMKIPVGVLNEGISGNKLLVDGAGESALKRFDRDVLSQPGVRWVIFSDDPINDLGSGNPPSGAQLIDGLKQLVKNAHDNGIEFWCSTLTPYEGSGGWKPEGETARAAIISFIKQPDSGCDKIVDQDTATHDPTKPTWFLPANDAGDHLHPNEKGLQAIADAVPLSGFTAPAGNGGSGGAGGSEAMAGSAGMAGAATAAAGGASAGAPATGGTGGVGGGSAGGNSASGSDGVLNGSAGTSGMAGGGTTAAGGGGASPTPTDSSCSCRTPGSPASPERDLATLALSLGLASSIFARRRRSVRISGR
ncbi:MAG TPA: SGNH/GDSL hydrolase family protein [Polyangiaceae bacterium]|nr:SGNH/GDSL hydrolase family protein [Polyangiaceae bacterium]